MPSTSKSSRPKPSEIASEAKKVYIPLVKKQAERWKTFSYLYVDPLAQLSFTGFDRPYMGGPSFYVSTGDPTDTALQWAQSLGIRVPLICAAHDKRAGGDFETAAHGYEEKLCRRSTLSATLATPGPGSHVASNYPIPISGGILSDSVVVFRGSHEQYSKWDQHQWRDMPVCSVPPMRWPKLNPRDKSYSFEQERQMVKDKLTAAIRICVYNQYTHLVIGDFGLGNSYRNPPQELAEIWRDIFLWDPEIRGRVQAVAFVFEDAAQSTEGFIDDEFAKKSKSSGSRGKSASSSNSSGSSSSLASASNHRRTGRADYAIFQDTFTPMEVARLQTVRDPRYSFGNIISG